MFYTRFCELSNSNNSTPTRVVETLGMSKGNLDRWRKGGIPSVEVIQKMSAYFNVSTDYLLGTEEKTTPQEQPLDKNQQKLINRVKMLSPEQAKKTLEYLDFLDHQENH